MCDILLSTNFDQLFTKMLIPHKTLKRLRLKEIIKHFQIYNTICGTQRVNIKRIKKDKEKTTYKTIKYA